MPLKYFDGEEVHIEHSATAFMFLATALVQLMTPGVGLLYSGMVPTISTVQMITQSFVNLGLVFVLWMFCAFSLAFGKPMIQIGGYTLLNSPKTYFMLDNVDIHSPLERAGGEVAAGMPGMLFMAFHGMFAVVTPALVTGAFTDRFRFGPYVIFVIIWIFVVYVPLACWNWGGGWMFQLGAWDFAGGMVVHECAGWSAFGCLLALGRRVNPPPRHNEAPHNMVLIVAGTALLWFGWFGFNGGSALTIGGLATIAFINTQVCPATAMITWVALDWIFKKRPSLLGACCGALSGLVVITPWSGFAQPSAALLAGVFAGLWCWVWAEIIRRKTNLDDACDVFSIHGLGGWFGSVCVGIFSDPPACLDRQNHPKWCANPGTCARGLAQTWIQVVVATFCAVYVCVASFLILKVLQCLRISTTKDNEKEQMMTYDHFEFDEVAYRHPHPVGPYMHVEMPAPEPTYYDSDESSEENSESVSMLGHEKKRMQNLTHGHDGM
eukprot:TRINITY_DN28154_c0_g4_i1.p1 TRINITY_DN28154_c0_g4~~TRINITY_DN28154_c0_g4_i1.p1  ORF type:complete len:494 (+),score=71.20 TRINITY_DN28154_c0_g4_i1:247-1728(+)